MRRRDEPIYPLLGLWNFGTIALPITSYFARQQCRAHIGSHDCQPIHAFICRRIVTGGKLRRRRKNDVRAGPSITGTMKLFRIK